MKIIKINAAVLESIRLTVNSIGVKGVEDCSKVLAIVELINKLLSGEGEDAILDK